MCQYGYQWLSWTIISYDANATSLPDGEIVADPTSPATWIVPSASKLSLSKADLIGLPFFGASSWSKCGMVVVVAQMREMPHEGIWW